MEELTKVVINTRNGGFGLSNEGIQLYKKLNNGVCENRSLCRHDPLLIKVVEDLGEVSYGKYAGLTIIRIPSVFRDCYRINEYEGEESIDLSSNLLIEHELKLFDVANMSANKCKEFLLALQKISETNYYNLMY